MPLSDNFSSMWFDGFWLRKMDCKYIRINNFKSLANYKLLAKVNLYNKGKLPCQKTKTAKNK